MIPQEVARQFLARHFPDDVKAFSRIHIASDIEMYRWREDPYLWKQKKGKAHKYFTVYFDNVFICGFDEGMHPEEVDLAFLRGIQKQQEGGEIFFYPHQKPEEQPKQAPAPLPKATTPEQKAAQEIVKQLEEDAKTPGKHRKKNTQ